MQGGYKILDPRVKLTNAMNKMMHHHEKYGCTAMKFFDVIGIATLVHHFLIVVDNNLQRGAPFFLWYTVFLWCTFFLNMGV